MRLWCVELCRAHACARVVHPARPNGSASRPHPARHHGSASRPRTDCRVPLPSAATHSPATWSWQMATPPAVRRWARVTRPQATQLGQTSRVAPCAQEAQLLLTPASQVRHCMVGSPQPASRPLTRGLPPPGRLGTQRGGSIPTRANSPPHLHESAHGHSPERHGVRVSACLRLQPGRLRLQASRSSRRATTRPSPPQTSPSKARTSPSAHIGSQPARVRLQPAARTVAGMISGLLRMEFPQDRFMGEEDAAARPHGQTCPLGRARGRLLRLGDIGRYSEI